VGGVMSCWCLCASVQHGVRARTVDGLVGFGTLGGPN
jgi:hypothetical protein